MRESMEHKRQVELDKKEEKEVASLVLVEEVDPPVLVMQMGGRRSGDVSGDEVELSRSELVTVLPASSNIAPSYWERAAAQKEAWVY